jgi:hypothetical protein
MSPLSTPPAHSLTSDVAQFCENAGIAHYVSEAQTLIKQHFNAASTPQFRVEEDPETGVRYLDIALTVQGTVEEVLDSYDRFTDQWVARVPDWARAHIRFAYSIA